jgi:hypothetical protein
VDRVLLFHRCCTLLGIHLNFSAIKYEAEQKSKKAGFLGKIKEEKDSEIGEGGENEGNSDGDDAGDESEERVKVVQNEEESILGDKNSYGILQEFLSDPFSFTVSPCFEFILKIPAKPY